MGSQPLLSAYLSTGPPSPSSTSHPSPLPAASSAIRAPGLPGMIAGRTPHRFLSLSSATPAPRICVLRKTTATLTSTSPTVTRLSLTSPARTPRLSATRAPPKHIARTGASSHVPLTLPHSESMPGTSSVSRLRSTDVDLAGIT